MKNYKKEFCENPKITVKETEAILDKFLIGLNMAVDGVITIKES